MDWLDLSVLMQKHNGKVSGECQHRKPDLKKISISPLRYMVVIVNLRGKEKERDKKKHANLHRSHAVSRVSSHLTSLTCSLLSTPSYIPPPLKALKTRYIRRLLPAVRRTEEFPRVNEPRSS